MPYVPSLERTIGLIGDPAPNWRWVVALPTLRPRTTIPGYPVTLTGLTPSAVGPFGMVNRITFGTRTIESDSRFVGGRKFNYARTITTPASSITFYENSRYDMTQYLRTWSNLVVDQNNNYAPSAFYKFPITLFTYDVVNNTMPSMVGTLLGCWPPSVSGYEYGYDASGIVTLTSEFVVDEDTVAVGGLGNLGGSSGNIPYSTFATLYGNGPPIPNKVNNN
jgi:hypothetical protein